MHSWPSRRPARAASRAPEQIETRADAGPHRARAARRRSAPRRPHHPPGAAAEPPSGSALPEHDDMRAVGARTSVSGAMAVSTRPIELADLRRRPDIASRRSARRPARGSPCAAPRSVRRRRAAGRAAVRPRQTGTISPAARSLMRRASPRGLRAPPSTVAMRAKRPASTSSVRALISAALQRAPGGIGHREGQRRLADEIDLVAEIGGVARRRLAALLGADAGDDHAANAVLGQPDVEPAADERAVAALAEDGVRLDTRAASRVRTWPER